MASVPFNNLSLDLKYVDDNKLDALDGHDGYSAIASGTKLASRLDPYLHIGEDKTCMGAMDIDLTLNQ